MLIVSHQADVPTQEIYGDIKATLGLPFVNTDYRALARWPSYFAMAWNDLHPLVRSENYENALGRVHAAAVELISELPNPSNLSPEKFCASVQ